MELKKQLRHRINQRVQHLSKVEKKEKAGFIIDKIRSLDIWQEAKTVVFYSPMSNEVDILPLLVNQQKLYYFPRYDKKHHIYELALVDHYHKQMKKKRYGIPEPLDECSVLDKTKVDLWFIPAIAFDVRGYRLGHGYGYYDRLLEDSSGYRLGICFSCQQVEALPVQSHDQKVNQIISY